MITLVTTSAASSRSADATLRGGTHTRQARARSGPSRQYSPPPRRVATTAIAPNTDDAAYRQRTSFRRDHIPVRPSPRASRRRPRRLRASFGTSAICHSKEPARSVSGPLSFAPTCQRTTPIRPTRTLAHRSGNSTTVQSRTRWSTSSTRRERTSAPSKMARSPTFAIISVRTVRPGRG